MSDNAPKGALTNPFALSTDDGYTWLKGNLHSHTTNSDGKATPQERLDGYVGQGYDFLCLSDHHKITFIDTVQAPSDFVLIQGAELHPDNPFGGQRHHFVCLNLHEDMNAEKMPPQHVIDEVRRQGGAVWLAHPHWSSVNILRDAVPLSGFAGIEVFNTTCRCAGRGESSVHWDDWMDLEDRLYPALANDDSHALEADQRDTYQGWTWVRVKERTADAVVAALVAGASYGSTGPAIHDIQTPPHRPRRRRPAPRLKLRCPARRRSASPQCPTLSAPSIISTEPSLRPRLLRSGPTPAGCASRSSMTEVVRPGPIRLT